MAEPLTDLVGIIQKALSALDGQFDLYELTAGYVNNNETQNYTLIYPAYYVTNITSTYSFTSDEIMSNLSNPNFGGAANLLNKEPFVGGIVAMSFVLCGIVTAGWMFFLLLLLSSHSIPNSLMLTNLFFCSGHTVMLVKLTNILQDQVRKNYADTSYVLNYITYSNDIVVVRSITSLLIWISWVDLLVQITKYNRRRTVLVSGLVLSLVSFAFAIAYGFITGETHTGKGHQVVKYLHYITEYAMITMFDYQVLLYFFKKRKFAFHRKAIALSIFTMCTLLTPYAFNTMDLVSNSLRSWSTYVLSFTKLCITIVTWEWLHTIRSLQLKYEKKAVLGRKISHDDFTQMMGSDPGESLNPSDNTYILRSINIVRALCYLNPMRWIRAMSGNALSKDKTEQDVERISLRTVDHDEFSRRPSNFSQESGISIVADHPRFDVDHRYLRNTPSTLHSRNTPISYTNATPDIPEGLQVHHIPGNSNSTEPPPDPRLDNNE